MNKVKLNVKVEKKVDNRKNNTGRPVNNLSARQVRLRKQAFYNKQHVCNVNYIGRTKVTGYTFVLGRYINVNINLKEVKFDYKYI